LKPIPHLDEYILEYVVGVFMMHHHAPDMPVQPLLVLAHYGRVGSFAGSGLLKLQEQCLIIDMHAGVYYIKNTALMTGRGLNSLKQHVKRYCCAIFVG
jgi:hypothetical protein